MKLCKHYFVFLLAGALLLLPITSQYALSWKELRDRVSKYDTETLQKNLPGALMALGIGTALYYWWMSGGIAGSIHFEIEGRQGTQFPIYSQFWWYGGGAASCGYHTLLRGMQIVQAKAHNENNKDLAKKLMSSDLIAGYFGKNGIWRQLIMQQRQNDEHYGDWLWGYELERLWKEQEKLRQQNRGIISNDVTCGFTAIDDFSLIGMRVQSNVFDESGKQLEDEHGHPILKERNLDDRINEIKVKLAEMIDSQMPYFHLFGIGTMQQSGDQPGQAGGHWFAIVLYQHADGNREYFVTDSFNNKARDNDERVIKLIVAIEDVVATEEI